MSSVDHPSFKAVLTTVRAQVQNYLDLSDSVVEGIARSAPEGVSSRMQKLIQRKGKKIRSTILSLIATSGDNAPDTRLRRH